MDRIINDSILSDIADAIRGKTGESGAIVPEDMAGEIDGISVVLYGTAYPSADIGSDGDIYMLCADGCIKNKYGQFINTGYSGGNNSRYVIQFILTESQASGYPTVFGGRPRTDSILDSSNVSIGNSNNYDVTLCGWGNYQEFAFNFGANSMLNKFIEIDLSAGLLKMTIDGVEHTFEFTPLDITSTTPIGIFAQLANGSLGSWSPINGMILLDFKIFENNTLVHHFIPAKDQSDIICVYDDIAQEYKYDTSGLGPFQYIDPGAILLTYLKVNGVWQSISRSNIFDVSTD